MRTMKWSGKVTFRFREDKQDVRDNSYYLWFGDDGMICAFPPGDATHQWQNRKLYKDMEEIFNIDLSLELPEVSKQWSGEVGFEQIRDTPVFEFFINGKPVNKFSARSPLALWVEKNFEINLLDWVAEQWRDGSEHFDWKKDGGLDKKLANREQQLIRRKEQKNLEKDNQKKLKELLEKTDKSDIAACWIETARIGLVRAMTSTASSSYETTIKIKQLIDECDRLTQLL